jgi:hypothetical protein
MAAWLVYQIIQVVQVKLENWNEIIDNKNVCIESHIFIETWPLMLEISVHCVDSQLNSTFMIHVRQSEHKFTFIYIAQFLVVSLKNW